MCVLAKARGVVSDMPEYLYPIGAHIRIARSQLGFPYSHHGIYIGRRQVVHFHGHKAAQNKIARTGLDEFLNGQIKDEATVATLNPLFSKGDIRARALSLVYVASGGVSESKIHPTTSLPELQKMVTKYDLAANNCEHIARWCVVGDRESGQVGEWIGPLGQLLVRLFE